MKDGFYNDMPFEEYAAIDAINGSSIVHMRRSPMSYRHMLDNPPESTAAQVLGVATHRMILEPNRIGDMAIWGAVSEHRTKGGNMRPRNGKDWDSFEAANAGKLIVTADERDAMVGCAVAVHKNPIARKYIAAPGATEVSMIWTEPMFGRRFKGRIDKMLEKGRTIVDLKTTRDCTPYRFGGQAYTLGYHIKAALYWLGYRALTGIEPHFKFVAVESKAPHESAVYRAHPDIISQGLDDLAGLMKTLAECEASGTWPAAQQEEADLTLPTYAFSEVADDLSDLALV